MFKLPVAQTNEVPCKIPCHNICCLIQSMFELGLKLVFEAMRIKPGLIFRLSEIELLKGKIQTR